MYTHILTLAAVLMQQLSNVRAKEIVFNVKHVLGQRGEIAAEREVIVKLNMRHYCRTVIDLLDWAPPKKNALLALQSKGKDNNKKTGEKVFT